jgi:uncharacterized protein involved in exopolysaccharide biosynthesis
MDDEIDLHDIFRVLWKRRLLIIGFFVVAVLVAGAISFSMPSVYRVSSIIAVGNFEDPVYTSQTSVISIMLSDGFLMEVFEQLSPNATGSMSGAFKGSIKVEPVKDNDRLIEISVETPERQEGKEAVEKIVWLYAKRSDDSYNKHKKILFDQLAVTQERLDVIDMEINQTLEALQDIQDSSGPSTVQTEMRFSHTMDLLSGIGAQRSALIGRSLDIQKQLELIRNLEVVQPAREPVSPIGPRRILIVAVAGMLGLMTGILAAFLREELGSRQNDGLLGT